MVTTIDKPSIAELQRQHREGTGLQLLDVEGELLEIAAAAKEVAACRCVDGCDPSMRGHVSYCPIWLAAERLDAALAKVRP